MKKFLFLILLSILYTIPAKANQNDLNKIEDYLNNLTSLKANFIQMASNGGTAE